MKLYVLRGAITIANENKSRSAENIAVAEASREIIQRYGEAGREFVKAYSGFDAETGRELSRSLKGISQSRVNPGYVSQNLRQQSGFSAEVLDTARRNSDAIIRGDSSRALRTDDLTRRTDSRFGEIGGTNDQLYDQAVIRDGRIAEASQFKFVGGSPDEALTKLAGKKFRKYLDSDAKITVPSDYFDGIKESAGRRISELQSQKASALTRGDRAKAEDLDEKIRCYEKIRRNLRKSNLTNEEAMNARVNPLMTTAKEIAGVSHQAGIQGAKMGAGISGGVSAVRNMCAVISGEKDFSDAAINIIYDTGTGAALGYVSNFGVSALTGVMKNSASGLMRSIAKTNLPAQIVTAVFETGKTLLRFASGEIDGVECLEDLGVKGTGMLSAAMFAGYGQLMIPIPVVGAAVGSMIGYALSGALYGKLKESLTSAKLAHEERLRVERECEEAVKEIRKFRAEMEALISEYLTSHITAFHSAFGIMNEALAVGDADGFISGANMITQKLGGNVQFRNMREFDSLMDSDEAFAL